MSKLILAIAAFVFSYSANAAELSPKQNVKGTNGEVRTFNDGYSHCVVYSAFRSASITCTLNGQLPDLRQLQEEVIIKHFNVTRKVVEGKLCYVYDSAQNADIDCLM